MRTTLEKGHGHGRGLGGGLARRWAALAATGRRDAGMSTAEYAVGTIAACALAAVLLAIVRSGGVSELITNVITTALSVAL